MIVLVSDGFLSSHETAASSTENVLIRKTHPTPYAALYSNTTVVAALLAAAADVNFTNQVTYSAYRELVLLFW